MNPLPVVPTLIPSSSSPTSPSWLAAPASPTLHQAADALDHLAHAALARSSTGMSPVSMGRAWTDWALNLAVSPGTQARLFTEAQTLGLAWLGAQHAALSQLPTAQNSADATAPEPHSAAHDARFADPAWSAWPWNALATANLACERWWQSAIALRGMEPHAREQLQFLTQQELNMVSPSNSLLLNPQALRKAADTHGQSLATGLGHAVDAWRERHGLAPLRAGAETLAPGQGLATTPGQVVMRNDLVELIRYQPSTAQVLAEPVLIIPSCIMKYYILDLSPHNSMVRWLVSQGHTVYIVSWRNPDEDDALLTLDDYVRLGVLDALARVQADTQQPVHLAGYCLGGTFTAIAAAALAHQEAATDAPAALASLTLMAAETDFSEPGEMGVLIDAAQVAMLESMTAEQGFLTGRQMAGSFQLLHSRELVWQQRTRSVLLGEPTFSNDLMAWNADVTRLPAVMHSQYLRSMYLGNDLALGRYSFDGQVVSLHDIAVPVFVVGTVKDHVSPWRSVFKIHRLVDTDVTFVLTNGGHNAGIVSEPGHAGRHYQIHTTEHGQHRPHPDDWAHSAPRREGSWWQAWSGWLQTHSAGEPVAAQTVAETAWGAAPGQYVMLRHGD